MKINRDSKKYRRELLTEELTGLANTMRWPLKVERELEEFLPEIGGNRERLLANEGSDQVLRSLLRPRAAALARRWRHRPHSQVVDSHWVDSQSKAEPGDIRAVLTGWHQWQWRKTQQRWGFGGVGSVGFYRDWKCSSLCWGDKQLRNEGFRDFTER